MTGAYTPARIRWEVVPRPGVFRWALVKNDFVQRLYLFKAWAIAAAQAAAEYDLEVCELSSTLTVHNRDNDIEYRRRIGPEPRRS